MKTRTIARSRLMQGYRIEAILLIAVCIGFVMAYFINPSTTAQQEFKTYIKILIEPVTHILIMFTIFFTIIMLSKVSEFCAQYLHILHLDAFTVGTTATKNLAVKFLRDVRSRLFADGEYCALVGTSSEHSLSKRRTFRLALVAAAVIAMLLCMKGGASWFASINLAILAILRVMWFKVFDLAADSADMIAIKLMKVEQEAKVSLAENPDE